MEPLPNPIEWAKGSEAYIEARFSAPGIGIAGQENQLSAIWNVGLRLKEVVRIVTGDAALARVAEQYASSSHNEKPDSFDVVKHVRLIFKRLSDEKKFHPKPFEQSPEIGAITVDGNTYYETTRAGVRVFVKKLDKDDPIDRALEMDLIELRHLGRAPLTLLAGHIGLESNRDAYQFSIKAGEKYGQTFGRITDGRLFGYVIESVTQGGQSSSRISWSSDESFFIKDIFELKQFCKGLVEDATYQFIQREIPLRIRNDSTDMSTFESIGVIGELFGAIARWRRSATNYSIQDISLASVNLLATKEALADLVNDRIARAKPKYSSDWDQVEREVIGALKNQTDFIRGIGDGIPAGKSIPVVDETLLRLMAYMDANGISFNAPGRPTGSR